MIQISEDALRDGCERAHDLFLLNRLRAHNEAATSFEAVYTACSGEPDGPTSYDGIQPSATSDRSVLAYSRTCRRPA